MNRGVNPGLVVRQYFITRLVIETADLRTVTCRLSAPGVKRRVAFKRRQPIRRARSIDGGKPTRSLSDRPNGAMRGLRRDFNRRPNWTSPVDADAALLGRNILPLGALFARRRYWRARFNGRFNRSARLRRFDRFCRRFARSDAIFLTPRIRYVTALNVDNADAAIGRRRTIPIRASPEKLGVRDRRERRNKDRRGRDKNTSFDHIDLLID